MAARRSATVAPTLRQPQVPRLERSPFKWFPFDRIEESFTGMPWNFPVDYGVQLLASHSLTPRPLLKGITLRSPLLKATLVVVPNIFCHHLIFKHIHMSRRQLLEAHASRI